MNIDSATELEKSVLLQEVNEVSAKMIDTKLESVTKDDSLEDVMKFDHILAEDAYEEDLTSLNTVDYLSGIDDCVECENSHTNQHNTLSRIYNHVDDNNLNTYAKESVNDFANNDLSLVIAHHNLNIHSENDTNVLQSYAASSPMNDKSINLSSSNFNPYNPESEEKTLHTEYYVNNSTENQKSNHHQLLEFVFEFCFSHPVDSQDFQYFYCEYQDYFQQYDLIKKDDLTYKYCDYDYDVDKKISHFSFAMKNNSLNLQDFPELCEGERFSFMPPYHAQLNKEICHQGWIWNSYETVSIDCDIISYLRKI